jgi:RNA 3'-terminal phosphate cyclase (ATP)
MLEIDGSLYSGSGTLLRYAIALTTLTGESLHMTRIRARRDKPGLRPQHLQAIRACSFLCSGRLEGDQVGSAEIRYWPGKSLKQGDFEWDIGTAGSATMLASTLIPLGLFAPGSCRFSIIGGLFQDYAPSIFHMHEVLVPTLRKMGADLHLTMLRPGYVPKGQGHLALAVKPVEEPLRPLRMVEPGRVREVRGISLASHLREERVSERMAGRCQKLLREKGYAARIETIEDQTALQRGAALFLKATTDTDCLLGADRAGKPGRRSEAIAGHVVRSLFEDLETGATVDRHLADQLILFAALAVGTTEYRIPRLTDHIQSNLWLVQRILQTKVERNEGRLRLEGFGLPRPRA